MKQKAKIVAVETVGEHVYFVDVTNVLFSLETAWRTEFLEPDNLLKRDGEQH